MAASSSSSSSQEKYDVFLSFRGEDTRVGFTGYLYHALCQKCIHTYMDEQTLESGFEISPTLKRAIQESKIYIIVLSKNFASSTWCLDELVEVLECKRNKNGKNIIPIFYGIDPSIVRKQEQSYETAFANHEQRFYDKLEKVQQWRGALKEVADLSGYHSKNFRVEHELVQQIVGDVLSKLCKFQLTDFGHLIGIEDNIKKIESLLSIGSRDFRIIGIWGIGGIGKTTLASIMFQKYAYSHFDDHCFLKDILEGADAYHLRNELLSQLVNDKNVVCTDTPAIGSRFIQDRLRYKKVFIFLDNLNGSSTKLKALFGEYHFAIGSRVIVTTRDVQLLRKVGAKTFELKGLSDFDALKLFCFHSFGQHLPATGYESLSKGIADYARGNPLALEVLGSSLNSKNVKEWESASNKLKTYLNPDIQNVLRISSDKLGDKGIQDIFVDTACFSTGEMLREYLESILNCTEHFDAAKGISALVDKSLQIEWQYPSRGAFLEKHDLLQQMGHRIVCDENKDLGIRNRLWKAKDVSQWQYPSIAAKDVRQWQCPSIGAFLEKHGLPLQTGKGIVCDQNKDLGNHNRLRKAKDVSQRQYPSRGAFKEKHGLLPQTKESGKRNRLLKAKDVSQWQYPSVGAFLEKHGLPLQTAQGIVCDENRDLGNRNRLWKVNDVCRVLERNTGTSTIEGISLNLGDLEKDIKLSPTAFSKMYNLKFLKIMHSNGGGFHMVMKEYCKTAPPGYKSMPDSFDCGCKSIHIPDGLESFVSGEIKYFHWDLYPLKYLPCLNTENLVKLTMQQSQLELLWNDAQPLELKKLKKIDLSFSKHLIRIPNLSRAINLKDIILKDCTSLVQIPSFFQNLNKLQLLDMANCKNLEDGIEYLPINLRDLKMGGTAIKNLPESIRKLKYLTVLDLHHCKNLRKIPQISNHKEESPESIENLTELKCLDLNRGHKSEFLPSSPCELLHLQKLILAECSSLEELPPLPHGLKELNIANCERLKSIAELPSSISYLDADNCTSLETISSWGSPPKPPFRGRNHNYTFKNCLKLDEDTRNKVIADRARLLSLSSQDDAWRFVHIMYPGDEIPKWFSYQTDGGNSTNIHLPPNWFKLRLRLRWRFVFCIVFYDISYQYLDIGYEFGFKTSDDRLYKYGDRFHSGFLGATNSDHVFIDSKYLYNSDKNLSDVFGPNWSSICSNITQASFRVFFKDEKDSYVGKIKKVGFRFCNAEYGFEELNVERASSNQLSGHQHDGDSLPHNNSKRIKLMGQYITVSLPNK